MTPLSAVGRVSSARAVRVRLSWRPSCVDLENRYGTNRSIEGSNPPSAEVTVGKPIAGRRSQRWSPIGRKRPGGRALLTIGRRSHRRRSALGETAGGEGREAHRGHGRRAAVETTRVAVHVRRRQKESAGASVSNAAGRPTGPLGLEAAPAPPNRPNALPSSALVPLGGTAGAVPRAPVGIRLAARGGNRPPTAYLSPR